MSETSIDPDKSNISHVNETITGDLSDDPYSSVFAASESDFEEAFSAEIMNDPDYNVQKRVSSINDNIRQTSTRQ